jgi:3-dehydrosphinganine reductase
LEDKTVKKNILITGGSSGIGLALANKYAALGYDLFLISRNKEKLNAATINLREKFPSCNIHFFVADVSKEEDVKSVYGQVSNLTKKLDIVICNAGIMMCGRFETNQPVESHKTFEINYWGMHYTAYYFLPLLKATPNSKIAFMSSVAGYTGLFGYTHYAPAKFAISGLAECLRMEFKDYGINVSVIYPPDMETPMLAYERENTLPECKALSKGAKSITVQKAAAKIAAGIEKKKFEIYFNFESRLIRILKGIVPAVYYRIVDNMIRKSRKK